MVRLVGASEAAAGVAALFLGGAAAWAVGLLYAVFAAVALRALLAGAGSCGCFGRLDAPPSRIHVLGNLVLAGVSFAAAGAPAPPIPAIMQVMGDSPAAGARAGGRWSRLVAGLILVSFTALPEALGARTSGSRRLGSVPSRATAGRQRGDVSGRGRTAVSRKLVERVSRVVDRRAGRRGFLRSSAMAATAMAVAPVAYAVRPTTAEAAIVLCKGHQCNTGALCCDNYTEFCCKLTGENLCPPGTVVAGWWKVDGTGFCDLNGPRPRVLLRLQLHL